MSEMLEEITKFEREKLAARGYKINDRTFGAVNGKEGINSLFSDDYKKLSFPYQDKDAVYSGAEYILIPKLSNITYLLNLVERGGNVAGSTFGHQHTQKEKGDIRRFQEIYHFLRYGAMLLRNKDKTMLYVLKPGEKVVVGTGDNMTIFNLDTSPLVTLDMANPKMNSANKDLEHNIGPLMLARYTSKGVFFIINQKYHEKGLLIRRDKGMIALPNTKAGESIYNALYRQEKAFEEEGITLAYGSNIPSDLKKEFSPSLFELALQQNPTLLNCLEMGKTK